MRGTREELSACSLAPPGGPTPISARAWQPTSPLGLRVLSSGARGPVWRRPSSAPHLTSASCSPCPWAVGFSSSTFPSRKWVQDPPWGAETRVGVQREESAVCPWVSSSLWSVAGSREVARGSKAAWGWGTGPPLPPGQPARRPWRTAPLSQEGRVTKTDKSICQEEALEKESLNSCSQEAQKGNCSRRWRRQQAPSFRALRLGLPSFHMSWEHLGPGAAPARATCPGPWGPRATVWPRTQSPAQSEGA